MTSAELREKLTSLTPAEFEAFRRDIGGEGTTIDWFLDRFIRSTEVYERVFCEYFKMPTEQEKVTKANVDAAEAARVSAEASVNSARYAEEANRIAKEANE